VSSAASRLAGHCSGEHAACRHGGGQGRPAAAGDDDRARTGGRRIARGRDPGAGLFPWPGGARRSGLHAGRKAGCDQPRGRATGAHAGRGREGRVATVGQHAPTQGPRRAIRVSKRALHRDSGGRRRGRLARRDLGSHRAESHRGADPLHQGANEQGGDGAGGGRLSGLLERGAEPILRSGEPPRTGPGGVAGTAAPALGGDQAVRLRLRLVGHVGGPAAEPIRGQFRRHPGGRRQRLPARLLHPAKPHRGRHGPAAQRLVRRWCRDRLARPGDDAGRPRALGGRAAGVDRRTAGRALYRAGNHPQPCHRGLLSRDPRAPAGGAPAEAGSRGADLHQDAGQTGGGRFHQRPRRPDTGALGRAVPARFLPFRRRGGAGAARDAGAKRRADRLPDGTLADRGLPRLQRSRPAQRGAIPGGADGQHPGRTEQPPILLPPHHAKETRP